MITMAQIFEDLELVERQKARRVRALSGVAGHKTGTDTDKIKSEFAAQKATSAHSSEVLAYLANLSTTGHNTKLRKQARKFMGMRGHGCPAGEHMTFGKCQKVGTHEENKMRMHRLIRRIEESMEPGSVRVGVPDGLEEKKAVVVGDHEKFSRVQRLADYLKDLVQRTHVESGGYTSGFASLNDPDISALGAQADETLKRCSTDLSDMYAKVLDVEKPLGKRLKKGGMAGVQFSDQI